MQISEKENCKLILYYVGLSRVTTFEGLNITDLCENKIGVLHDVAKEMDRLRTSAKLIPHSHQLNKFA